jgi:hypothetical protein
MSLTDKLAGFFAKREGQWIDGRELATVAGAYGWRSRCSDLRQRGLQIDNRQRRVRTANGTVVISEYRFVALKGQMELSL